MPGTLNQFINTLHQIYHADSVALPYGVYRHIAWQVRKGLQRFPVELTLSQSRLLVDRSGGVGALVNCLGLYDYNNMSLLKLLLASGGVFFDVGANVGSYTLVASEAPAATVVAFEPHPHTLALLKHNIELNQRTNVQLCHVAVSATSGELWLTDNPELSINRVTDIPAGGQLRVRSAPLDQLCEELALKPRLVKIDVEGHELPVLQGLSRTLPEVEIFFIEKAERPAIQALLHDAGFLGPFYVHFKQRTLLRQPQARAEDPVFVADHFRNELVSLGFALPDQAEQVV